MKLANHSPTYLKFSTVLSDFHVAVSENSGSTADQYEQEIRRREPHSGIMRRLETLSLTSPQSVATVAMRYDTVYLRALKS